MTIVESPASTTNVRPPCPEWCEVSHDHEFDQEPDYDRIHEQTFGGSGCIEYSLDDAGREAVAVREWTRDIDRPAARMKAAAFLYQVAAEARAAADYLSPITDEHRKAWTMFAEAMGTTLEDLAERAGVDLEHGTALDGRRIGECVADLATARSEARR